MYIESVYVYCEQTRRRVAVIANTVCSATCVVHS